MAALLSVFHPVPPVIRRRAKELLDTIRDAVKGALGSSSAADGSVEVATTTTSTTSTEAEADMSVDDTPTAVVNSTSMVSSVSSDSLWTNGEYRLFESCRGEASANAVV